MCVRTYNTVASKSPIIGRLTTMRSVFAIRGFDREKLQVRDTLVNIHGKRDDQGEGIEFAGRVRKQPPLREHRASPMAATGMGREREEGNERERESLRILRNFKSPSVRVHRGARVSTCCTFVTHSP